MSSIDTARQHDQLRLEPTHISSCVLTHGSTADQLLLCRTNAAEPMQQMLVQSVKSRVKC